MRYLSCIQSRLLFSFLFQISYECASTVADLFQIPYVETSALSGFNVELLFRKVAKDLYVEELDRQRQIEDSDVQEEKREDGKVVKLFKTKEQRKAIPRKYDRCRCS